jgi:hypothetical protein
MFSITSAFPKEKDIEVILIIYIRSSHFTMEDHLA